MKKQTKREQIARAKAARLMEQVQSLGLLLKASVVHRRFRCGKAGCRCVRGYLHQDLIVTRRVAGISQTIRVRQGRETEALVWLENWRRLKQILSRLTAVEMQIPYLFSHPKTTFLIKVSTLPPPLFQGTILPKI